MAGDAVIVPDDAYIWRPREIAEYLNEGHTLREAAVLVGTTLTTVKRALNKDGYRYRHNRGWIRDDD